MQKLAKIRRVNSEGAESDAAVNPKQVRHVYGTPEGTYIAFDDAHDPSDPSVTPIGVLSPESVKTVIRRLNLPYWIDLSLRFVGLLITAATIAAVIKFS